jgi:hypothetical protein
MQTVAAKRRLVFMIYPSAVYRSLRASFRRTDRSIID